MRVGEKEIVGASGDRRALRGSLHAGAARRARARRDGGRRRRPGEADEAAAHVRGRHPRTRAGRARRRARERAPRGPCPVAGRGAAVAQRSSASRDACLVRRAGRARRRGAAGVRVVQRRPEVAPGGARGARCRALRRGEPGGAQRGGEGNRARASARGARRHARGDDRRLHDGTRPVVRPPPRRGARCNPVVRARGVAATAVTARDDVHARAIGAGVQRHTRRARPRSRSRAAASGWTSTTGRRSRRARV